MAQVSLRQQIIAAEDARVATEKAIAPVLEGLRAADASTVAVAARALGRFERPGFIAHLLPLLTHPGPDARREAANALGQSVAALPRSDGSSSTELETVARALRERIDAERDPSVTGTIAETLGRLPYRDAAAVRATELSLQKYLPDLTGAAEQPLHTASLVGAVKGIESLIRTNRALWQPDAVTVARLKALAASTLSRVDDRSVVMRRMAWMAVNAGAAADLPLIEQGYEDRDAQVRRLTVVAVGTVTASEQQRRAYLVRALRDPSFHVRFEAVRVFGRVLKGGDCAPLFAATRDDNTHVALGAIDALGGGCSSAEAIRVLVAFIEQLTPTEWHRAAHALASLAAVDAEEAKRHLPRFVGHPTWQVRAYAARAAATIGDAGALDKLARDRNDNVKHEAVQGLRKLHGRDADAIYIGALGSRDYQLVLAAAEALKGTPNRDAAVPALVRAFRRLTSERRETSRDPRLALLERLRELGSRRDAGPMQPCLRDFDPVVAAACAAMLEAWTGSNAIPRPQPPRPVPVSAALPARARVTMAGGRSFELALLAEDAPASVSRFAQLASRKYYNGLTFHRVLPNFIIQGGSPGANEYEGDGPFMRDELGLRSNARGTVGVSTRGRDTGDAQFYINLLDNPRLDHEYTVFAEVVSGMDVVDEILEGDTIARIDIR